MKDVFIFLFSYGCSGIMYLLRYDDVAQTSAPAEKGYIAGVMM